MNVISYVSDYYLKLYQRSNVDNCLTSLFNTGKHDISVNISVKESWTEGVSLILAFTKFLMVILGSIDIVVVCFSNIYCKFEMVRNPGNFIKYLLTHLTWMMLWSCHGKFWVERQVTWYAIFGQIGHGLGDTNLLSRAKTRVTEKTCH